MNIDPKTIDRIKKLLNLARDGGATEAEANLAMERAEAIMLENNLSIAAIEASGGIGEQRLKEEQGNANYRWQRKMMEAIAKANFIDMEVSFKRVAKRNGYRDAATGYQLIGRVSNVTAAKQMYEYLIQTASRLRREYAEEKNETSGLILHSTKDAALFVDGLGNRLAERIEARHAVLLREQREKAEAEAAARRASAAEGGRGDTSVPVVILDDYAQTEREANNDVRHGYPVGTTTAKRKEREARSAENDRKMKEVMAAGYSWDIAYYVVYMQMTLERAIETDLKDRARKAAEEAAPKKKTKERAYRYRKTREDYQAEWDARKSYTAGWRAGTAAADKVSLDDQIAKESSAKKLR